MVTSEKVREHWRVHLKMNYILLEVRITKLWQFEGNAVGIETKK
jgi:hypothetical protein